MVFKFGTVQKQSENMRGSHHLQHKNAITKWNYQWPWVAKKKYVYSKQAREKIILYLRRINYKKLTQEQFLYKNEYSVILSSQLKKE